MLDEANSQLVLERLIRTILRTAAPDRKGAAWFAILAVTAANLDRARLAHIHSQRAAAERLFDEFRSANGVYVAFSSLAELSELGGTLRPAIAERILSIVLDTPFPPSPLLLGELYQRLLIDDRTRRAQGVFYTPVKVAETLVRETLSDDLRPWNGRIFDPACGCGVLLLVAWRRLLNSLPMPPTLMEATRLLTERIFGCDLDRKAVAICRATLALELARFAAPHDVGPNPDRILNIQVRDALDDSSGEKFEYVLANPPFVGSRMLTLREGIAWKKRISARYETAWGAYDLFVPFTQRCLESLALGGRLGLIVPDKISSADYAAKLRVMLLARTTIERFIDLSGASVFTKANVYPQLFVATERIAGGDHMISCSTAKHVDRLDALPPAILQPQRSLSAAGFRWEESKTLALRLPTESLGSRAKIHGGTIGFAASRTLAALCEEQNTPPSESWEFITSGNIERGRITRGHVRFMGRTFDRPRLVAERLKLSEHRKRLYRREKIVVSGISKRLKCAYDAEGLALGVAVLAVTDYQDDVHFLLALLNSKLLTFLYLTGGPVRRHDSRYFAVTKSRLQTLPIRTIAESDTAGRSLSQHIIDLCVAADLRNESDQAIDRLIYELYGLSQEEIALVEESFPNA